jgi:hypothetical protein
VTGRPEHWHPRLAALLRGRRVRWRLPGIGISIRGREAGAPADRLPLTVDAPPADMSDPDHHVADKAFAQTDLNSQDARCDRSPCPALDAGIATKVLISNTLGPA